MSVVSFCKRPSSLPVADEKRVYRTIPAIESNPGPATNSCRIYQKLVKRNDKAIQCDDCDQWIHARCTGIDKDTYIKLQKSYDKWYCSNCIAPCGLCSGSIYNYDRAIECDKCKTWIHTSCATVSDDDYKVIQTTNCTWICPTCDTANLSTSFSSSSPGIETSNPYQILTENRIPENDRSAQDKLQHTCRNINKITMVSININGIRVKKNLSYRPICQQKILI